MREWRKLHKGILSSEKLAQVSDGAALLFHFLIVAQDDAGAYPWTPTKIKSLTVTRDWSIDRSNELLTELVQSKLVVLTGSLLTITGGREKNGVPTSGSKSYREPRYYEVEQAVSTQVLLSKYSVPTREEKTEERRGEKRGTGGEASPPTFSKKIEPFKKEKPKAEHIYPEWFETTIVPLSGFVRRDYSKIISLVEKECSDKNVLPADLGQVFAEYYALNRLRLGWTDPGKAFSFNYPKDLAQLLRGNGAKPHSGRRYAPDGTEDSGREWPDPIEDEKEERVGDH